MRAREEVSDADWAVLEPLLRFPQRADRRGRPPADTREVLNGVLRILRTGGSAGWLSATNFMLRTSSAWSGLAA
jgi:transposase